MADETPKTVIEQAIVTLRWQLTPRMFCGQLMESPGVVLSPAEATAVLIELLNIMEIHQKVIPK